MENFFQPLFCSDNMNMKKSLPDLRKRVKI